MANFTIPTTVPATGNGQAKFSRASAQMIVIPTSTTGSSSAARPTVGQLWPRA